MQLENGKIIAIKAALKPDGGPVAGKLPNSIPGRPPNPAQMAPKMPLKPPVDRNLAALSSRRGMFVIRYCTLCSKITYYCSFVESNSVIFLRKQFPYSGTKELRFDIFF